MPDNQLLLMVQATCVPEHLDPFTAWYNSHLPNLLRIPGYLWAQRYMGLEEENRLPPFMGSAAKMTCRTCSIGRDRNCILLRPASLQIGKN